VLRQLGGYLEQAGELVEFSGVEIGDGYFVVTGRKQAAEP
jgi:hypothetical protein